jgi:hypothetical protein
MSDVAAVFPALRTASNALFCILAIIYDGSETDTMVENAVRERRGIFEKLDQQSQALAPQIAAWLADHPLAHDGN